MKLQQFRYLLAIVKNNLNISAAAESLYTSQPGISKQIRQLEDELGVELFNRNGKHLTHITPAGQRIMEKAELIIKETSNIQAIASEFKDDKRGTLTIATTHTQARYALPEVIQSFRQKYPDVALEIHQGSPAQIANFALSGAADFVIATEAFELFDDLIMLPCYEWQRSLVVPAGHALTKVKSPTLELVAAYPLVTYVFGFDPRSKLDIAFRSHDLRPKIALTATDTDVIKTYVRLGMGVGIIADMAHDSDQDQDLVKIPADHLFQSSVTRIGFRRGIYMRQYMYDFITLFADHLDKAMIRKAEKCQSHNEVAELLENLSLPAR